MILRRNNVQISGKGQRAIMFVHGFGCNQHMWDAVAPAFETDYRVILFDHVGAGGSDLSAYSSDKYGTLAGYARDVVEIGRELGLQNAVFVGHSVSAMIGALASIDAPDMFADLVMVGPSPRYLDDGDYSGGFSQDQIDDLLAFLADNHLGWSAAMAPMIMGNPDRPELGNGSRPASAPPIRRSHASSPRLPSSRTTAPTSRRLPRARLFSSAARISSPPSRLASM